MRLPSCGVGATSISSLASARPWRMSTLSRPGLIERGWYLGPLDHRARALGSIYLPTLLWVWWMRPTASQPVWAYLAAAVGDRGAALREGARALERLAWHARWLGGLAAPGDP